MSKCDEFTVLQEHARSGTQPNLELLGHLAQCPDCIAGVADAAAPPTPVRTRGAVSTRGAGSAQSLSDQDKKFLDAMDRDVRQRLGL
jgi:hypothetical protein